MINTVHLSLQAALCRQSVVVGLRVLLTRFRCRLAEKRGGRRPHQARQGHHQGQWCAAARPTPAGHPAGSVDARRKFCFFTPLLTGHFAVYTGTPIELLEPEILRFKIFEPVLLLGKERFSNVDVRVRVSGGGHVSQVYGARKAAQSSPSFLWRLCGLQKLRKNSQ